MTEKEAHRLFQLRRSRHRAELRKRFGSKAEFYALEAEDQAILAQCFAIEHGGADSRDILIAITEQLSQNHNLIEVLNRAIKPRKKSQKKKS